MISFETLIVFLKDNCKNMKLKNTLSYHTIFFIVWYMVYILWDFTISNTKDYFKFDLISFLFSASLILSVFIVYVLNFHTFCHWFLNRKRIVLYILSIPLTLLVFAGIRYLLQEIIIYELTGFHNYYEKSRQAAYYIRDNFFFGMPSIILSTLAYLLLKFQQYQQQNHQLLLENKKAEFQLLKSQVSPHFLFNTLNSFYSDWIDKDAEAAADLLKLSDLLRYVITETDKEYVLLSKELQFIENYIQLQEKRFENQLYLDFTIEGSVKNQLILPSVLIHFTENVFKHGKLNDPDKPATISIAIKKDFLEISTQNYKQSGENYSSTGIGFENLTKRLKYTYGESFLLEKTKENDTFKTYLKIPLKSNS